MTESYSEPCSKAIPKKASLTVSRFAVTSVVKDRSTAMKKLEMVPGPTTLIVLVSGSATMAAPDPSPVIEKPLSATGALAPAGGEIVMQSPEAVRSAVSVYVPPAVMANGHVVMGFVGRATELV